MAVQGQQDQLAPMELLVRREQQDLRASRVPEAERQELPGRQGPQALQVLAAELQGLQVPRVPSERRVRLVPMARLELQVQTVTQAPQAPRVQVV